MPLSYSLLFVEVFLWSLIVCLFVCLFVLQCRDDAETSSLLDTWRIINLMRGLGAFLGWVLVALQPTKDYTARKKLQMK